MDSEYDFNFPFQDPKFLFQLYVRLRMYKESAKTALIIAQAEQAKGFYKAVHDLLFGQFNCLSADEQI